ncbi:MAG: trypsin-like peptidase domain-containing protein [Bacteroidaceae bacterium]|nr:trypsin-like peptidase domain-containing protein [Bacteroidaceae bacterium]
MKCRLTFLVFLLYVTNIIYAQKQASEWAGTGFALTNNHIVTNYHVIDGAKTISVLGINGDFNHKYSAEVVTNDKYNDLAIIKVNGINISSASIPYTIKTIVSEVGEDILF